LLVLGLLYYEFITPNLTRETRLTITLVDTLCCAVFLIDFFFRRSCADSRTWFWKRYWVDFVTSIPIPDAHLLRFGRLARVARVARAVRFLRLLRALRVIFFFWRGMDKLSEVLDVRLMKRSLMLGASLLLVGGFVIYWLEGRHQGVDSIGQSIWWSFTTVVTGGFPDIHNPISTSARLLTVFLVLGGMTIVGIFTATLTSTLLGDDSAQIALMQKQLEEKLDRLSHQVETIGLNRGRNEDSN
jgi:voltage-gated potassium channel